MKIILSLIVILSFQILPQDAPPLSKIDLQTNINTTVFNFTDVNIQFNNVRAERKKPALALLYSLLLPGMGELYAEQYSVGKYLTIAEGALWISYFGINSYGNWQVNNYKAYAASTGGVNHEDKSADYYATISEYNTIYDYNDRMALDRRFSRMLNVETHYWDWGSTSTRRAYREMWVSSEQSFNNLRFVVGALIVNRLVSAIMAVRATNRYNRNLNGEVGWNIYFGVSEINNIPSGMNLNLITRF
jgi:hypothetical protein